MVEKYIGKEAADGIFRIGARLALKKGMSKSAQITPKDVWEALKSLGGSVSTGLGKLWEAAKDIPPAIGWTAGVGAGAGVLGASAYDIIKERLSHEDPDAKFNTDMEILYAAKKKELEDAKWMDRIRALRDELKRGYKKMPIREYAAKYKALLDALDERRA